MNFDTAAWSCSFCGKRGSDDTRFAGGLGALMCQECLESFSAAISAPENAHLKIIGWSDETMPDAEMLARLPLIATTARQVDRYLRLWVGRIRERHISYAEIGKALGVSRQAAWERFSRSVEQTNGDGAKTPV
jgi:ClpX C4-type zinc finger